MFQREGSSNAACNLAVTHARTLLQDTWDAITVQTKYLADGMWPSEEFNTRRWLLARATMELLQYPVGWSRIARSFREGELDLSAYDFLSLLIRVDSNRDEEADDSTPLGVSLRSHRGPQRLWEKRVNLGDHQRQWIPLRFPLHDLIDQAGFGTAPWRSVSRVQLFVAEGDYAHDTKLSFRIRGVQLLRFTSPAIQTVSAPAYITLPNARLAVGFDIMGAQTIRAGSHTLEVSLISVNGNTHAARQQDLAEKRVVTLDTSTLAAGRYRLTLTITATDGSPCAQVMQPLEAVDGPLVR